MFASKFQVFITIGLNLLNLPKVLYDATKVYIYNIFNLINKDILNCAWNNFYCGSNMYIIS